MEWIGFLAMIALGGYATFAGVVMQIVTAGFCGKNSGVGFVIMTIGIVLLYLAWANKPFAIVAA